MDSDREWCRAFIDHHCIYRSPPGELTITGPDWNTNAWQFYLPIAVLDQEFAERVARLFWEQYADEYREQPFQLCGCESGGSLLVSVLQTIPAFKPYHMRDLAPVRAFMIKKAAKSYGLGNWLEGVVDSDLPVLLIDDVVGSGKTIRTQAQRLKEFGLNVIGQWAIVACKANVPEVETLFDASDFARLMPEYHRKYGKEPEFYGTIV